MELPRLTITVGPAGAVVAARIEGELGHVGSMMFRE
jgi:hypothetical protein